MNDLLLQKPSSSFSLFTIQPQNCFYTVMGFSFIPIDPPLYLSVILFLSFHIPCTNFFDFFKNYFMMSDGGGEGEWGGGILFLFLAPSLPFSLSLIASISVFIPPLVLYDLACGILPSLHVLFVFSLLSPLPTLSFCP